MDRDRMRQILETLRAEEVEGVLTFIKRNERAGHMDAEEADEWRRGSRDPPLRASVPMALKCFSVESRQSSVTETETTDSHRQALWADRFRSYNLNREGGPRTDRREPNSGSGTPAGAAARPQCHDPPDASVAGTGASRGGRYRRGAQAGRDLHRAGCLVPAAKWPVHLPRE